MIYTEVSYKLKMSCSKLKLRVMPFFIPNFRQIKYISILVVCVLMYQDVLATPSVQKQTSISQINSIKILSSTDTRILLDVDYTYDGNHDFDSFISVWPKVTGHRIQSSVRTDSKRLKKGNHSAKIYIFRYEKVPEEHVTDHLEFIMKRDVLTTGGDPNIKPYQICSTEQKFRILWPDLGKGSAKLFLRDGNPAKLNTKYQLAKSSIRSTRLIKSDPSRLIYEVDYYYDGSLGENAYLVAYAFGGDIDQHFAENTHTQSARLYEGENTAEVVILRNNFTRDKHTTDKITFKIQGSVKYVDAGKQKYQPILHHRKTFKEEVHWPENVVLGKQVKTKPHPVESLLHTATILIDSGEIQNLRRAKELINQVLVVEPKSIPAHIQLARYYFAFGVDEKNLVKAEDILKRAEKIDNKNAEVFVLLGKVYSFQNRFEEANIIFQQAKNLGTDNLWLYINWGMMYERMGKFEKAVDRYETATDQVNVSFKNMRALQFGYVMYIRLLAELDNNRDLTKIYERRSYAFPNNGCYFAEYAEFELLKQGNISQAIRLGEKSIKLACDSHDQAARSLALAYYTKWANNNSNSSLTKEVNSEYYQKANLLYSNMANIIASISQSKYTQNVIPELIKRGISVDTKDKRNITALGLVVQAGSLYGLQTLIKHGANVNAQQGSSGWTPLMFAVYHGHKDIVKELVRLGADVNIKSNDGITAHKIAVGRGLNEIAKLLIPYIKI